MGKKGRIPRSERQKRKAARKSARGRESHLEILESWARNFELEKEWRVFFDGATGPTNPGLSGYGAVLYRNGVEVDTRARQIGHATSNQAEYRGLIAGLEMALEHNASELVVCGDSQLILKQTFRQMRVATPHLEPLRNHGQELAGRFAFIADAWIRRERNSRADELSRAGIPVLEKNYPAAKEADLRTMRQSVKVILENSSIMRANEVAFVFKMEVQLEGARGNMSEKQWKWIQDIEARLYANTTPIISSLRPRLIKAGSPNG